MMKKMKDLLLLMKREIFAARADKYFYSTSINTSCAIPVLRNKRAIWLFEVLDNEGPEVLYYWADHIDEKHLVEKFLLDSDEIFMVREYELKF